MTERLTPEGHFTKLFKGYALSDNDIAWSLFKAGWDARAQHEYELDLRIAELEHEIKQMKERHGTV